MKQLRKIYTNKTKLTINKKIYTKKMYRLKIFKLKLSYNFKTNVEFYMNNLNKYQNHLNNIGQNGTFYTSYSSDDLNDMFFSGKYHTFDSYLTSIELINYDYIKLRFNLKYKYSMLTYFIPFLIKNGKKLFTINRVLVAISNIYNNLNYNNINNFNNFQYINQFKHYIDTTDDVYNLNFLIH
jgi:hypothetical protein